ncbi:MULTISPECIES: type III secretion apparatus protein RspB [unclassified Pseudomonas]|uniref:type III secretion apparatus protein RspB n=1 Tax=unclassified Pseudomonas TaxID=196821 RepID=UPI002113E687|nr:MULTISPECIES: type III secretion apparatus protein RspB [unclassified Pseudomonas]
MLIANYEIMEHADLYKPIKTPDHATADTDISFFSSQLGHSTSSRIAAEKLDSSNLLIAASEQFDTTKAKITKQLKTLSKQIDRDAMRKYPNELSNTLFMSQILVKSLGKTTQCIDKICNLQ